MAIKSIGRPHNDSDNIQVHALVTGRLPEHAVTKLRVLVELYGGTFDDKATMAGTRPRLNAAQQRILDTLRAAEGPMSSLELSEQTGIVRGSLRPYLSRLVEAGYVRRLPGNYGPARFEAIR